MEEHNDNLKKISSGPIQDEVLTINSEHPYSEDHLERKSELSVMSS